MKNQFTITRLFASVVGAFCLALTLCAQVGGSAQAPAPSQDINDYVCPQLDDFTAIMKVVSHNSDAGAKINSAFNLVYDLKGDVKVHYKEENKLRLDARIKTADVIFVVNGTKQIVIAKSMGIRNTTDLGPNPGKRKTLLDVGMISKGYMSYSNAEFKGVVNYNGTNCSKFRLWYQDKSDTSFRLVWIDPKTKITLKREDYSQKGKLNATYTYFDPKEIAPGIWFPTHVAAANNEGQKAGELSYNDVKVNQGIDDSVFNPK